MNVINIRLENSQVKEMDRQVENLHYNSRSEYVREAIRRMMEDHMELSDETVEAIKIARKQEDIPDEEAKKLLGL